MELVNQRSVYVVAGHLRLDVDCSSDGTPDTAIVYDCSESMEKPRQIFDGPVEDLERAAAAVREIRALIDDRRGVCPDHGYCVLPCSLCSVGSWASDNRDV
jgi:hypothetical protein